MKGEFDNDSIAQICYAGVSSGGRSTSDGPTEELRIKRIIGIRRIGKVVKTIDRKYV